MAGIASLNLGAILTDRLQQLTPVANFAPDYRYPFTEHTQSEK